MLCPAYRAINNPDEKGLYLRAFPESRRPDSNRGSLGYECFSRVSLCHSEFVEVARNSLQMDLCRQLVPNVAGHFVTAFDGGMLAEMLAK